MAKEKDSALEAMRWICILAVVCHHGISVQRQSPGVVDGIRAFQDWIQWCVPGFFLVSGYLQPTDRPLLGQFLSRARRLLVPYLAVSLASFALVAILHRTGIQPYPEAETLTLAALASKIAWLSGFGPQLYFLPYLLVVWLLVVPLLKLVGSRWIAALFAALLLFQGIVWIFPLGVLGQGLDKFVAYAFAFSLGVSMRAWGREREGVFAGLVLAAGAVLSALLGSWWAVSLASPPVLKWGLSRLPLERPVAVLGRLGRPGGIYLWHAPLVLPACSKVLGMAGVLDWPNYAGSCVLSCLVALAIDRLLSLHRATRWVTL